MLDDRADLGLIMADLDRMSRMEEGTMGRVFHSFMSGADILPGYIIGGMVYRDGHFDKLIDWDDDAKYLMERSGNTHDSTHILSGYGTDFCGEILNIPFSIGGGGMSVGLAKFFGGVVGLVSIPIIMPSIGIRKWIALCIDAGARGAEMAKHNPIIEVYFESLLETQVPVVREQLHIPPHKHQEYVNSDGWMVSESWLRGSIGKRAATGFGKFEDECKTFAADIVSLVKAGFSIRKVMSAPKENIMAAAKSLAANEDKQSIEKMLVLS